MRAIDVLVAARERISDPTKWCVGTLAADRDGNTMYITTGASEHDSPVRWCAKGAVLTESFRLYHAQTVAMRLLRDVAREMVDAESDSKVDPIIIVNDHLQHDDVLRMFDSAIERARYAPEPL